MKKKLIVAVLCLAAGHLFAQDQDPKSLDATAKDFIRKGDYPNAIIVLNRALEKDASNLEMLEDLAFANYLNRNYSKALEIAKPLTERRDADVQSFQLLGMIYKAIEERKECEKMYRSAIKKFPASGALYNEYGELMAAESQSGTAIKLWEKGIETDPNHSGNYYNAAKFYYSSGDKVWPLIYGEIFVNLESYSKRTAEIKTMLMDGYKKLFSDDLNRNLNTKNEFVKAFVEGIKKQAAALNNGLSAESLSVLRTRFILDWFEKEATRFPFRLFDYHRQLLKAGMFDAYNQWIFGAAKDLGAFQQWTTNHAQEYNDFSKFQRGRVFKLPPGQYYQTGQR